MSLLQCYPSSKGHHFICAVQLSMSSRCLLCIYYTVLENQQSSRDAAISYARQKHPASCAAPGIKLYDKAQNQLHLINTTLKNKLPKSKAIALASCEFLPKGHFCLDTNRDTVLTRAVATHFWLVGRFGLLHQPF